MENEHFRSKCKEIDNMSEKELIAFLETLDKDKSKLLLSNAVNAVNAIFCRDIIIPAFQMRAKRRLKKIKR